MNPFFFFLNGVLCSCWALTLKDDALFVLQNQIFKPFLHLLLRARSLVGVIPLEMLMVWSFYSIYKVIRCGMCSFHPLVHVDWSLLVQLSMIELWTLGADTFSGPGSSSDEPQSGGWLHKFTVGAYKPFFDVDTSDVVDRLKESLFPFRGTFTEKTADKPDL